MSVPHEIALDSKSQTCKLHGKPHRLPHCKVCIGLLAHRAVVLISYSTSYPGGCCVVQLHRLCYPTLLEENPCCEPSYKAALLGCAAAPAEAEIQSKPDLRKQCMVNGSGLIDLMESLAQPLCALGHSAVLATTAEPSGLGSPGRTSGFGS